MAEYRSIMKLCKDAGRIELLDEIWFSEYNKTKTRTSRINPVKDEIYWKCHKCGDWTRMTFDKRIKTESVRCKRCIAKDKKINNTKREGTKGELSDLCKLLHTSMPEQYIFTYIRKLYPNTIRGKKFDWLGPSEFDIFIPKLNLAIEYDGNYWHREESFMGFLKDDLARDNGITLFRIREKGLEELEDTNYYIYNYNRTYANIYEAINAVIKFINNRYGKDFEIINSELWNEINGWMEQEILENLRNEKYKISIANLWSGIEECWDYEHNEGLKPSDILPTAHFRVWATCPYCGKLEYFCPYVVYRGISKNAFAPHECDERNEYCLKLLKNKIENNSVTLSMDDLDDKKLKDWLMAIAQGLLWNDRGVYEKIREMGFDCSMEGLIEKYKIAKWEDFYYRKTNHEDVC